jgi:putative SOS response-associated peptidase YedK
VPADGFYEWQRRGGRTRPWLFRVVDEPGFCMAGLWETWSPPDAEPLHTCTLLTTAANALLRPIHDRMPVILRREDYERWLTAQPDAATGLRDLLRPFPAESMIAWPVGDLVNSPRNDAPACTEPIGAAAVPSAEKDGDSDGQLSLL